MYPTLLTCYAIYILYVIHIIIVLKITKESNYVHVFKFALKYYSELLVLYFNVSIVCYLPLLLHSWEMLHFLLYYIYLTA